MRPALRILPRLRPFCILPARTYATLNPHTPPPTSPYQVFDEPSKDLQRSRAIIRLRELQAQSENGSAEEEDGLRVVDYLREEIADRLAERMEVRCSLLLVLSATLLTNGRHIGFEGTAIVHPRAFFPCGPVNASFARGLGR